MKKNLQHLFHTYIYIFFLRETSGKQNNRQYRNKFSKPEKQVIICTLWFLYKWCICIIKSVTHSSNTYIHCQTQLSFIKICLVHWNSSITELFKKKKKNSTKGWKESILDISLDACCFKRESFFNRESSPLFLAHIEEA